MFWMLWALLFAAWTFVATARQWTLPKHSLVPKAHQERIALTAPSRMRQCFHLQMNSIPEVDGRLFQCWKQRKENCNPMPASRKEKTRCWLMKNNWKERTNTSGTTTCLRKGLQGICEPRPVWLCFSCFGFLQLGLRLSFLAFVRKIKEKRSNSAYQKNRFWGLEAVQEVQPDVASWGLQVLYDA